MQNLKLDLV